MGYLERPRRIDGAALDQEEYVKALLAAGLEAGALTQADLERIQIRLLALLARKTERYTGRESSSVQVETAQALMTSNLFTIGLYLKGLSCADEAAETMRTEEMETLYAKGRQKIAAKVRATRERHNHYLRRLAPIPNEVYLSTARDGIAGFFQLYDPEFAAQEIHITADYPLCNPVGRLAGIEFIQRYLDGLICENAFLSRFDLDTVCGLLSRFDPDWKPLIFNLFEQVLAAAVGCVLTGADPAGLHAPAAAVRELQAAMLCKSRGALGGLVEAAAGALCAALALPASTARYVTNALPNLTSNVAIGVEHLFLERVFL